LKHISNIESVKFKNVVDLTSSYIPYSYLLEIKAENFIFLKNDYNFNLNILEDSDKLIDIKDLINNKLNFEKANNLLSLDIKKDKISDIDLSKSTFKISERLIIAKSNEMESDFFSKFKLCENDLLDNSLLVFNMKNYNKKINKKLKLFRFQIIISNSFLQILDYLKNLLSPGYSLKDLKIKFLKEKFSEEKEFIMFVEVVKSDIKELKI